MTQRPFGHPDPLQDLRRVRTAQLLGGPGGAGGVAITGSGVMVVAFVTLLEQAADISPTAFVNTSDPGFYRVNYYLVTTAADAAAGTVTLTVGWTDYVQAQTVDSITLDLTALGDRIPGAPVSVVVAADAITYAVTHTGSYGTARFDLIAVVERLIDLADNLPGAPLDLTATAISSSEIDLAWTAVDGATGYHIERSLDSETFAWLSTVGTVTDYNDATCAASTQYWYRIRAFTATAVSDYSNIADATTLDEGGSGEIVGTFVGTHVTLARIVDGGTTTYGTTNLDLTDNVLTLEQSLPGPDISGTVYYATSGLAMHFVTDNAHSNGESCYVEVHCTLTHSGDASARLLFANVDWHTDYYGTGTGSLGPDNHDNGTYIYVANETQSLTLYSSTNQSYGANWYKDGYLAFNLDSPIDEGQSSTCVLTIESITVHYQSGGTSTWTFGA